MSALCICHRLQIFLQENRNYRDAHLMNAITDKNVKNILFVVDTLYILSIEQIRTEHFVLLCFLFSRADLFAKTVFRNSHYYKTINVKVVDVTSDILFFTI